MAIIEFYVLSTPRDVGVYAFARSISNASTQQLRHRVANGLPLLTWDTDDFPLTVERNQFYSRILSEVGRLESCDCDSQLVYRVTPTDPAEEVTREELGNLLQSDSEYEEQERD